MSISWPHARRRAGAASTTVLTLLAASLVGAVPAAAEAPDGVVPEGAWVDEFTGDGLDPRWTVVNEQPDAWSVDPAAGTLTLASQPGDTYQDSNTARNVMLLDVPAGDFTLVTSVEAPVAQDFQGAGVIAWQDMDSYVRAGLTHVSFADGGPVVLENGVETAGSYASTTTARPGSTGETLRLQRTGDTITTSYWADGAWQQAAEVTVTFPTTQVGLYALAAGAAPSHTAVFDFVALVAAEGDDVVPEGTFTLRGEADAPYLTADGGVLGLAAQRPTSSVRLSASPVDGADGALTLAADGRAVVVDDTGRLTLADGDVPGTPLRLTDAGGGRLVLRLADATAEQGYAGTVDGDLVIGARDDAVRLTLAAVSEAEATLSIDGDATDIEVSDDLYGLFYEDINYAADGGLYAELVRNRSFEFNGSDNASFTGLTAWQPVDGAAAEVVSDDGRLNETNRFYLRLDAPAAGAGIRNAGYNTGLALTEGDAYDFSVWARTATAQELTVRVTDGPGGAVVATGTVTVDGTDAWAKHEVTLTATATTTAGRLDVLAGAPGALSLDMVSLFPQDQWVGPVNGRYGLRKDLAEHLAALDPSFLRFPGGCVTNVGTFDSYADSGYQDRQRTYQWKETLGPVEERPTNWNFWGYNQSYGIGYLEYFLLAEDLGATPLPVVSVGANGCGSSIPEMTDDERIERWVADTVDIIEFANGDASTEWGAVRAALGHPEPFGLRYIGLGNEENTTTFEANFPRFRAAIEAAYPDVTIISNSGPDDAGARFEQLWEFNRAQGVDMVDEHYYNDPSWFLANTNRYDSYDRNGPEVFLGEYASRGNTFGNALAEAAYMTGLERNSDVVRMASYAPLFANEDYVQWSPDAIWFDNDESWLTPNYHVQHMFMNNVGDEVVPSAFDGPAVAPRDIDGGVFLSTWATSAAYDEVRVTAGGTGEVLFADDFSDASQWQPVAGEWAVADGEYVQSSTTVTDARSIVTDAYAKDWSSYTLEVDARKLAGSEGFLIGFAAGGANDFYWWNVGGWNNTRQALQRASGGTANEVMAVEGHSVETGRDYRVRVEVAGRSIRLYLDDVLQMEYTEPAPADVVHQVVTRDVETGDLVAKVVNTSDTVMRTTVEVSDVALEGTATVTELTAASLADTNTKADPDRVVPVERTLDGVSGSFTYELPAQSVTILRLATGSGGAVVEAIDDVVVETLVGEAPTLPTRATAHLSDGTSRQVVVTWDAVDPAVWQQPGEVVVEGTVSGTSVRARAVVTVVAAPEPDPQRGLVLHYALTGDGGTTATDLSGSGRDGAVLGGAELGPEGLVLDGVDDFVDLPDDVMAGLDGISVSVDVRIDPEQRTPYFLYGLGNSTGGSGDGYLFSTGDPYRAAIASGSWTTEQGVRASGDRRLDRGVWKHLTYTVEDGVSVLYEDGVEVGRAPVTITPGDIGGGSTTANHVGRSVYSGDRYLDGTVRDVRIHDRALTAAEARVLAQPVASAAVAADLESLDLGDTSAVEADLTLPTSAPDGSRVTWASSDPAVVSDSGAVTRPTPDAEPVTVTLTATVTRGAESGTRTFEVTVVPEPDDAEAVEADAAGVVIPNLDDVRGNITLPTAGPTGTTLAWSSSAPDVVSPTGEVTRPAHGGHAVVVELTVTATRGAASATRTYTATVQPLPAEEPLEAYFFPYFEGESTADGEQIHFAASEGNTVLEWQELNDGEPVLTSTLGEKGLRDPFIIRSPEGDRFYLLATDLRIYGGGNFAEAQESGSKHLMVWESTDLVSWGEQRMVKVSSDFAGNTWAPEAFWSDELGAYVVYWASNLYPTTEVEGRRTADSYNRMMYATTRDFVTFTEPQVWIDVRREAGRGTIDSTVVEHEGTYHRFTKDERNDVMMVLQEKSDDLLLPTTGAMGTSWELVTERIGEGTITHGEGPTVFKSNTEEKWYLFQDWPPYGGGNGYVPFETTDLDSGVWTPTEGADLPTSPRHGTVLPITQSELDRLVEAYQPDAFVESVDDVLVETPMGQAPTLPATVTAHMGDGSTQERAVTWDEVDPTAWAQPGEVVVAGTLDGGVGVRARAVVTVLETRTATTVRAYAVPSTVPAGLPSAVVATVRPAEREAALPAGTLEVSAGGVVVGTGSVGWGVGGAVVTTSGLEPGRHQLQVRYLGDGLHAPSTTTVVLRVVAPWGRSWVR
ncbi:alpha-L-arabinofuranosidase C-terminal domain-containing protein [Actinotalea sp. AC32]|nr:alpha-L-arabinofuranosidase C-terminal domain-containing protein [Actinotalea sp. AC32]